MPHDLAIEARNAQSLISLPASVQIVFAALRGLKHGVLLMQLPDGRVLSFGDGAGPCVEMRVRDYRFARRVIFSGDIGFAEGWMAGDWESPDLAALLTFLVRNGEHIMRYIAGGPGGRLINWLRHLGRANTRTGSRRNILAHYDLGNGFYEAWLDQTMTYSAARFEHPGQTLEGAQHAKYHALARMLELKPGEHVLEIGCGWGGFAEIAAKDYGARVTAITISDQQFAFARRRMAAAGLGGQVEIIRQDYRDIAGRYDKIASIEMFEAVGEAYWPMFFAKLKDALKPGGRAALQVITIRDDLFPRYRRRADFVQRFIFPGGMLPSIAAFRNHAVRAGLDWRGADLFGQDYARTLEAWMQRFEHNWPTIAAQGFEPRFKRLWLFYLAYCIAGFRTGRTDVAHIALGRSSVT